MLKKTITYPDFNGNTRTEDHYFNFTTTEIAEMELSTAGGLTAMIEGIIASQDQPAIVKIFKDLILKSYGVKSPDGKRFIKSEELSAEFSQTGAYDVLFMELATNAEKAAEFFNGIIPKNPNANPATPALTATSIAK